MAQHFGNICTNHVRAMRFVCDTLQHAPICDYNNRAYEQAGYSRKFSVYRNIVVKPGGFVTRDGDYSKDYFGGSEMQIDACDEYEIGKAGLK
jgi:hypothetical protein